MPGVIGFSPDSRPSFCDGCGSAFPWSTREERIYELENLLDEEDIDEADRAVVQEQLRRLRNANLTERDENQAGETIKRRAGRAVASGPVLRVMEGLVSAALRQQLVSSAAVSLRRPMNPTGSRCGPVSGTMSQSRKTSMRSAARGSVAEPGRDSGQGR